MELKWGIVLIITLLIEDLLSLMCCLFSRWCMENISLVNCFEGENVERNTGGSFLPSLTFKALILI